jgi:hypothetical protein
MTRRSYNSHCAECYIILNNKNRYLLGNKYLCDECYFKEIKMRDPNRIPIMLDGIKELWETMPDMRLCQLMTILIDTRENGISPFNIEDEMFMELLDKWNKKNLVRKLIK